VTAMDCCPAPIPSPIAVDAAPIPAPIPLATVPIPNCERRVRGLDGRQGCGDPGRRESVVSWRPKRQIGPIVDFQAGCCGFESHRPLLVPGSDNGCHRASPSANSPPLKALRRGPFPTAVLPIAATSGQTTPIAERRLAPRTALFSQGLAPRAPRWSLFRV